MPGLVLCSHGTRSKVGAARVSALVAAVAAALPDVDVREAHVDVHPPYLDDVVRPGDVIVPVLLAAGYHVEVDIASAAERVGAVVTPAMGPDDLLTDLLVARLSDDPADAAQPELLVLAAAGSSVPGSDRAVRAQAALLAEALGRPVLVGYGSAGRPLLPCLVARLRIEQPGRRIVAASYLLAPGHFQDRVLASGVAWASDPLLAETPDHRLVELLVSRYRSAVAPTP